MVEDVKSVSARKVTVQNYGTTEQGISKTSYLKVRTIPEDIKSPQELGWADDAPKDIERNPVHVLDLLSAYQRKPSVWEDELSELGIYRTTKEIPKDSPMRQLFSYDRQLGEIHRERFDLSKIKLHVNFKEGPMIG